MHKNNKHNAQYDLEKLVKVLPELQPHIFVNKHGNSTIDFANPESVKLLNTSLLKAYYNIDYWQFPEGNLCPPIPGRVDYIHYLNDLIKTLNITGVPKILDVGTGANCIYPLLGNAEYNWRFLASDCNEKAIASAENIIAKNNLKEEIKLILQKDENLIFKGILKPEDTFEATLCNPPFYKNEAEAIAATTRKLKGLGKSTDTVTRNFAGQANELWYKGGEKAFLHNYLYESSLFKTQCFWYTILVSNKDHVKTMKTSLTKLGATTIKVINMSLGNKQSRVVAWTFLNNKEQELWQSK
ncbi:23S rRNA (adenine(1618)-N(6))-methyltransferase RlmF [Lacinutrix sp. MedPE-SW]|uniref:23S rRNA (adenine(1618)-N(6))-methyltransferase RlmF n=1 Tax=Lacinutrix sp. MedPE-SW TaxID=1860087 RepID=UPI00091A51E9|nr:23S rRNA (adenine(1618)-N(6))-methyltransferase RlmF [Lacinutrix sp. MedPE-SW]OIQ24066.1 MAG: 23S rRNA (adenine(1618)-N(6))-methyltransferase [Lacinutrix sp. MedPE-SW]